MKMTVCRFINTGLSDPYTNMAIDEALLNKVRTPVLRVYSWKPPALSIGYGQKRVHNINLEYCNGSGIPVVRRITGGRAVYHDCELTYSFILPNGNSIVPDRVTLSYKKIASALQLIFGHFGIKATLKGRPGGRNKSICYMSAGWYELLVNNKKISGSAQRRGETGFLQHGSILQDFDFDIHKKIFNLSPEESMELPHKITSLKIETGQNITFNELTKAVVEGFAEEFCFKMEHDTLTKEETEETSMLCYHKYGSLAWTNVG